MPSNIRTKLRFALVLLVVLANGTVARSADLDPNLTTVDDLRELFKQSLKSAGFRPKLDYQAFDFLEELYEHRDNQRWQNLFRLIDEQLPSVRNQMVPNKDGVWITIGQWCDRLIQALPAEGIATIRLYVDARAKKALDESRSSLDLGELYQNYDRFSMSSYGHFFADQLGDALFEAGNYDDALLYWERVLNSHDSAGISEVRILLKQATALHRLGSTQKLHRLVDVIDDRFPNAALHIGGAEISATDYVIALVGGDGAHTPVSKPIVTFHPQSEDHWQWSTFWPEMATKDEIVPTFASDGEMCAVHLGTRTGGFNRRTGKLEWIVDMPAPTTAPVTSAGQVRVLGNLGRATTRYSSQSTTQLGDPVSFQNKFFVRMFNPVTANTRYYRYGIAELSSTVMAIESRTGKRLWTSTDSLDGLRIVSEPAVVAGEICLLVTSANSNDLALCALNPNSGDVNWSMPLGSINTGGVAFSPSNGRIIANGNHIYVIAGGDAVMAVNTKQRSIKWLYRIERSNLASQGRILNLRGRGLVVLRGRTLVPYQSTTALEVFVDGLDIYLFDPDKKNAVCLDRESLELRWRHRVIDGARLKHIDADNIYLMNGSNAYAVNRETGKAIWEANVSNNLGNLATIGRNVYVPCEQGLIEIEKTTGRRTIVQALPEAGKVERLLVDGQSAVAIAKNKVTLMSLADN